MAYKRGLSEYCAEFARVFRSAQRCALKGVRPLVRYRLTACLFLLLFAAPLLAQ